MAASLPPCIALAMEFRDSTNWAAMESVVKDGITVRSAKGAFGSVDSLYASAVFEGVAPSTVASVYAWNQKDAADKNSPMNSIDESRASLKLLGRVAAPDTTAIAKMVEERGDKFKADKTSPSWIAAEHLPDPSPTEEIVLSVGKSMAVFMNPRDFANRREPPMKLTPEQAARHGFAGETWITATLPYGGIPKQKGQERAVSFRWCVTAEALPDGRGTKFEMFFAYDFGSGVPSALINAGKTKVSKKVQKVEEQARRIKADNGGKDITPAEYLASRGAK